MICRTRQNNRRRGRLVPACALVLIVWVGLPPAALAQAVNNDFAGFARKNNEPIDIESDTLEVHDKDKIAIFKGNVKAVQAGMTLRSRELHVKYTGQQSVQQATQQTKQSNTEITEIKATGPVLITTAKEQTVTSEWALFDVQNQLVTIGGNVVLSQGENVIKGDRLVIDLKTGLSRFENTGEIAAGKPPRVKGLFMPKKPPDAKKDASKDADEEKKPDN